MPRGPTQRLYGFAAQYDVPRAEFHETVKLHGGDLEAARAHHRGQEYEATNFLRCVHCHRMHRGIRSRRDLEAYRNPPVEWCWPCGDWRCARAKCGGCDRGSANRLRVLDRMREAREEGAKVNLELARICLEAGIPWKGMDVTAEGGLSVARRGESRGVVGV